MAEFKRDGHIEFERPIWLADETDEPELVFIPIKRLIAEHQSGSRCQVFRRFVDVLSISAMEI